MKKQIEVYEGLLKDKTDGYRYSYEDKKIMIDDNNLEDILSNFMDQNVRLTIEVINKQDSA